jgi:hypothetical protein
MRVISVLLLAFALVTTATERATAAGINDPGNVAPAYQQQEVDDNDDTRVEVQLVVLGIVIATVFVFGSAMYLLRKRLGLVAPPPEPGVDAHH